MALQGSYEAFRDAHPSKTEPNKSQALDALVEATRKAIRECGDQNLVKSVLEEISGRKIDTSVDGKLENLFKD